MAYNPEILVVGSHVPGLFMRVKRLPVAGETVMGWDFQEPEDGGKGSHQAMAAARLGTRVSFVGCVGNDRIGDMAEQWLKRDGVDTKYLIRHPEVASGVGFILLAENGVPGMVVSMGANAELNESTVESAIKEYAGAKVLLTQFEIWPEVALFAARKARERGLISIINPAPAVEGFDSELNGANVLVPNETEAKVLLGIDPSDWCEGSDLARRLYQKSGCECVVVTLGEEGLAGYDQDGLWQIEPPKVQVVDTSGAGDVFCASFAVGLVRGKSFRQASEWACRVASLSVTRPGTIPSFPTGAEAAEV
jgi:ribokinase